MFFVWPMRSKGLEDAAAKRQNRDNEAILEAGFAE